MTSVTVNMILYKRPSSLIKILGNVYLSLCPDKFGIKVPCVLGLQSLGSYSLLIEPSYWDPETRGQVDSYIRAGEHS